MEVPGEEMGLRYISKGVLPKRELCRCVSFVVAFFGHLRCRSPKEALTWVGLHKNEDGKGEEGKWMHRLLASEKTEDHLLNYVIETPRIVLKF